MKVYKCINLVQAELAKTGISKDQRNAQQGFNFRGIDSIYNALAPLLASNGLCILPRVIERTVTERVTQKGGMLFYVVVKMQFAFVAAEDNSKHIVTTYGEAMDSGDKATNKAMSAAYKYACMQTFCIPTEGEGDADAETHQVVEPEPEKSTYQQVCEMIMLKGILKIEADAWCNQFGVDKLSEINETGLVQILNILQGR